MNYMINKDENNLYQSYRIHQITYNQSTSSGGSNEKYASTNSTSYHSPCPIDQFHCCEYLLFNQLYSLCKLAHANDTPSLQLL